MAVSSFWAATQICRAKSSISVSRNRRYIAALMGMSSPARMASMAIPASISVRVKPRLRRLDALRSMSSMPCSPRRVKSGPPLLWGAVCRNSYRFYIKLHFSTF